MLLATAIFLMLTVLTTNFASAKVPIVQLIDQTTPLLYEISVTNPGGPGIDKVSITVTAATIISYTDMVGWEETLDQVSGKDRLTWTAETRKDKLSTHKDMSFSFALSDDLFIVNWLTYAKKRFTGEIIYHL